MLQAGTLPVDDANDHLSRAWALAVELAESGRLNESDQGRLDHLQQLMTERGLLDGQAPG